MKQKGQGIIEFALIVPMLIAVGVAVVYVGIMFMDYTQYSNAARDAARDISVQTEVWNTDETSTTANELRQNIVNAINAGSGSEYETVVSRYAHPFSDIFKAKWKAQFYYLDSSTKVLKTTDQATKADTVEVSIELTTADGVEKGAYLNNWFDKLFQLPAIHYRMVLE